MWFVYILRCSDESFYTGITNDLAKRLKKHDQGRGARYTRCHRPLELVYVECVRDRSAALRREAAIKKLNRAAKRRLIERGK